MDKGSAPVAPLAEPWLRTEARAAATPQIRRAMALSALSAVLLVPQAWLLAAALADLLDGAAFDRVWPWLIPVPLLVLARVLLQGAADGAALTAGARLKSRVRRDLLDRLLAPGRGPTPATGAAAAAAIEGVEALEPYATRFLVNMGRLATLPLVILAVVLPQDWISALVLLGTAPAIPLFMVLIGGGAARLNQRNWLRLSRLSGRLLDGLQRLGTLRTLGAGEIEAQRLEGAAEAYRASTMAVLRVAFLSSLALEFFATLGVAVVAVLIGFRLLDGALAFQTGFFVLLLAPEFYAPLRQLGADYHARMEALAAAERLLETMGPPPPPAGTGRPRFSPALTVACDHISFDWDPDRSALRDVSFRLEPGVITALAGPSGAGKSTLVALLLGQRAPDSGRVLIDGHDLAGIDPAHWMRQVALIPQRPHMFAGSVLDNIRLAAPDATPEQVQVAARRASADGFIRALPLGYDTPLGEHGATLSGGQVQRIAIARAFLKTDARVLIMDEGAAGLDRDTEAALGAAIRDLSRDRTTLLVAHRQETLSLADRVIRIEAGRIVSGGTAAPDEAPT